MWELLSSKFSCPKYDSKISVATFRMSISEFVGESSVLVLLLIFSSEVIKIIPIALDRFLEVVSRRDKSSSQWFQDFLKIKTFCVVLKCNNSAHLFRFPIDNRIIVDSVGHSRQCES